ncbi:hypothetical protein [Pseudactinotalea sp. HY158]|uniref:hypothetical protein n=1 Tax=Pseudactinotalea sp. HY158 TaxID=2654547 RepID=UPI0018927F42|nr:hypothetical protein [Pseudactinotalea sp. HY158]
MATNRRLGEEFSRYVGEQIRGEASMRNISVSGLARLMEIDRATLHRYLTGTRPMPVPVLYEAAEAIGIAAAILVDRADARMSAEGYMLAASDTDYDQEIEDRQREP